VQPVSIRHAEFDRFRPFERTLLPCALAIHPHSMQAVQVFDHKLAAIEKDLRVIAGNAAVAKNQIVVRCASDPKRE
jgi:hypothetical protein